MTQSNPVKLFVDMALILQKYHSDFDVMMADRSYVGNEPIATGTCGSVDSMRSAVQSNSIAHPGLGGQGSPTSASDVADLHLIPQSALAQRRANGFLSKLFEVVTRNLTRDDHLGLTHDDHQSPEVG